MAGDTDLEREHTARAEQFVVDEAVRLFRFVCESRLGGKGYRPCECESPLERIFLVWSMAYAQQGCTDCFRVRPQHEVMACGNTYRLDFVAFVDEGIEKGWLQTKVAIELDGHGFHERTKEQVRTRDQRDRDLQREGWIVLHFSFSEFTANPLGCVEQASEAAGEWLDKSRAAALEIANSDKAKA